MGDNDLLDIGPLRRCHHVRGMNEVVVNQLTKAFTDRFATAYMGEVSFILDS